MNNNPADESSGDERPVVPPMAPPTGATAGPAHGSPETVLERALQARDRRHLLQAQAHERMGVEHGRQDPHANMNASRPAGGTWDRDANWDILRRVEANTVRPVDLNPQEYRAAMIASGSGGPAPGPSVQSSLPPQQQLEQYSPSVDESAASDELPPNQQPYTDPNPAPSAWANRMNDQTLSHHGQIPAGQQIDPIFAPSQTILAAPLTVTYGNTRTTTTTSMSGNSTTVTTVTTTVTGSRTVTITTTTTTMIDEGEGSADLPDMDMPESPFAASFEEAQQYASATFGDQ